jgi:hypothetical protein
MNALSVKNSPTKLVAMADVVPKKLNDNYDKLKTKFPGQVGCPPDRQFHGFVAYRQAMECLKPGDLVILGTPPLSVGSIRLRHRKGPAHLHGESRLRGRPHNAQMLRSPIFL